MVVAVDMVMAVGMVVAFAVAVGMEVVEKIWQVTSTGSFNGECVGRRDEAPVLTVVHTFQPHLCLKYPRRLTFHHSTLLSLVS